MDRLLTALHATRVWLARRRKAITALVLPGLTLLAPTLLAGELPTAAEWRVAAVTCLVTAVGVERIRNARPAVGRVRARG